MAEWFSEKLNCFSNLDNAQIREKVLSEIKIQLKNLNINESEEVTCNLDLKRLFCQLTSNDRLLEEQTCEALHAIFESTTPGPILWRYTTEICNLLSHELSIVRVLALGEILRVASSPNTLPKLLTKTDLLVKVTETIGDEILGVAQVAIEIMKKIGHDPEGLKLLYSGVLLRTLAKVIALGDIPKFRVYEVVIDIAKDGKEYLSASIKSGFLHSFISIIDSPDLLLQLNALQMMSELALTQEGLNFLEEHEILQKLAEKVARAHETPLSNLLIPGLMKFFGNVARLWPNEIFSRYPIVISALFDVFETDDPLILAVALDTLGYVSSTVKAKYALQELGNAMPSALKKIAEVIKTMSSQFKVRALNCLKGILNVPKSEQDNRILSLTKSWFDCLCEEPLKMIVSYCKQPFADIRLASFEVLAIIASQEWGQEYIASQPGLVEFLLDRGAESFKECKDAKYEVVKNLSESVPNIFDAQTMQNIKQFVSQGPFYVDLVTEVAIEGAS